MPALTYADIATRHSITPLVPQIILLFRLKINSAFEINIVKPYNFESSEGNSLVNEYDWTNIFYDSFRWKKDRYMYVYSSIFMQVQAAVHIKLSKWNHEYFSSYSAG